MLSEKFKIDEFNQHYESEHKKKLDFVTSEIKNFEDILQKLIDFQVAIPSWALGTGGTRFGRFSGTGEPRSLEEKMEDVGLLHALNQSSGAISLHIPWDIPKNYAAIKTLAAQLGLRFDAVNSNTFQDQPDQELSYKFGSLQHVKKAVRKQAIEHNIEVMKHGVELGSKALTVWLSDGSSFPGQLNFRKAFQNTLESFREIYAALPEGWKIFIEYNETFIFGQAIKPVFITMQFSLVFSVQLEQADHSFGHYICHFHEVHVNAGTNRAFHFQTIAIELTVFFD